MVILLQIYFSRLACSYDWQLEEGWALYLVCDLMFLLLLQVLTNIVQQGSHFVRCGVEGLGGELQRRGISRHQQWGARGIVCVFFGTCR